MRRWGLVVLLSVYAFVLMACGSSRDTNSKPVTADQVLSGRITYDFVPLTTPGDSTNGAALDFSATESRPVRGAEVELLGEQGDVLNRTVTDHNGEYRFGVAAQVPVRVRVLASVQHEGTPGWNLRIRDNTQGNALYALDGELRSTGTGHSRRNLHASSGWNGDAYTELRAAAPFAILDTLYQGKQRIMAYAPAQVFPPLTVHWSPHNRSAQGEIARGEIGTSYYLDGEIYLLGEADLDTDEFDRHVVLHEWGHYLEHQLYRSDTPGGPHSRNSLLDMRVAYSEGFANAFSAMMLDDPLFRDTLGTGQAGGGSFVVGERGGTLPRGWYSQVSVGDIFYRYYISAANQREYDIFHQTLSSPDYRQAQSLTSIYLFADQLHQYRPGALENILQQEQVLGQGQWGAGETNNGGSEHSLPVYRGLIPDGSAQTLCSGGAYGQYNKLLNRHYVALSIAVEGEYTLTLSAENRDAANVGFTLFKRGEILQRSEQKSAVQLQQTMTLVPGEYVLEVFDWRNLDVDTQAADTCIAVRVHP